MALPGTVKALAGESWGLARLVHIDKEAAAAEHGAMIEGGNRVARALAGHKALRVSMVAGLAACFRGVEMERGITSWVERRAMFHSAAEVRSWQKRCCKAADIDKAAKELSGN